MSLPKSETGNFSPENRPLTHMSAEQEETLKRELGKEHLAGIAEQEYSALFLPLGILRTLKEGTFSEEDRKRILSACETAINGFFGHHTDLFFTKKMWRDAMEDPSPVHIETCIDAIATSIRAWAEFCKKHVNTEEVEKEAKKRTGEDDQDPLYHFIHHQESTSIAIDLKDIADRSQDKNPEIYLFYAIQHAQHLAAIVEKLAPRIESGEINIDSDISEIREIIARAKESLVRALQERDHEADATELPKMDISKVDQKALAEMKEIAQALKGQKVVIG